MLTIITQLAYKYIKCIDLNFINNIYKKLKWYLLKINTTLIFCNFNLVFKLL